MDTDTLERHLPHIIDDLAQQGWSNRAFFLPPQLTARLAAECLTRAHNGQLNPAGIGRGTNQARNEQIRGDRIQWLEAGQSAASDEYLELMDQLRQALNQALFLGLEDYECHFAHYPAGAFYKKHLDRFRDDDRRTLSAVFYLNDDWQAEHGGALRIYPQQAEPQDILPQAGTMVLFISAELPHEVLPASRERLSLTGWFRRR